MRHGRGWSGAVPMLLTRRAPDHIARPNFFFRATFALHPPKSGSDDQGLPERMRVPCCPRAGLERDTDAEHARWFGCLEQWVNAYRAGKILVRSFAGDRKSTRLNSSHGYISYAVFCLKKQNNRSTNCSCFWMRSIQYFYI